MSAGRFGVVSNRFGYINKDVHPVFCFGHGLSYTKFEYLDLQLDAERVPAAGTLGVTARIRNAGEADADEVVQLYVSDKLSSMVRPERQLIGFARVSMKAGETKTLRFDIPLSQLAFLDGEMRWKVEGGEMTLFVGASCADIRLQKAFEIEGDAFVDPKTRGFYAIGRAD
jgi:beta-glucosidase